MYTHLFYQSSCEKMDEICTCEKTYLVGPDKLSDPWTALFRAY